MEARIPELISLVLIAVSLFAAMFILPRVERRLERERLQNWTIINREFIDFQEDCNG